MYELYSKNDKVINKINLWENAMRYISLGLIFTFFNFNFSILSYIMMYLGAMFLCLGLYKLKEENINFKIACNIAFVKIFLVTFNLLYYASRYNFNDKKVIIIKVIISMLFNSIILINANQELNFKKILKIIYMFNKEIDCYITKVLLNTNINTVNLPQT